MMPLRTAPVVTVLAHNPSSPGGGDPTSLPASPFPTRNPTRRTARATNRGTLKRDASQPSSTASTSVRSRATSSQPAERMPFTAIGLDGYASDTRMPTVPLCSYSARLSGFISRRP